MKNRTTPMKSASVFLAFNAIAALLLLSGCAPQGAKVAVSSMASESSTDSSPLGLIHSES